VKISETRFIFVFITRKLSSLCSLLWVYFCQILLRSPPVTVIKRITVFLYLYFRGPGSSVGIAT